MKIRHIVLAVSTIAALSPMIASASAEKASAQRGQGDRSHAVEREDHDARFRVLRLILRNSVSQERHCF